MSRLIGVTGWTAVGAVLLSGLACAQAGGDQERLRAQRSEKLAKPVFKNAAWRLDYDAARREAEADGKLILTYFTRSYAP